MSTCISSAGEFGSHQLDESGPHRFVCRLCWALDEDQILATVADAEARLARVEALTVCTTGPDGRECADCRILGGHGVSIADVRAALAAVEPATEEADRG